MNKVHYDMHKGLDLINQGYLIRSQVWREEIVFSWRWWFGVALTLVSWGIWIIFRKRTSSDRLMFSGLFVMVVSVSLDAIGMQLNAWHYLYPIFPVIPSYFPYDFALMPVSVMLLIQFKPRIKPIYKGVIFAILTSLVGEPVFIFLGIYDPIHWKLYYSTPAYFVIYLIADHLSKRKNFSFIND